MMSFMGILVETSMNVTFPQLIREFKTPLSTVQWITTGYLLLVTIVMGCTAFVMRRFAAKRIFIFAVLNFVVGTLLCAVAPNFFLLIIGRLLQAISTGLSTPLMFHIILMKIPVRRRGTYVGIASMIIALAPALGPTYGGVLTACLSWRFIFWIVIPVTFVVFWLGVHNIAIQATGDAAHFDYPGLLLLSCAFASAVWAFNQAGIYGWLSSSFFAFLALCFVLLIALLIYNHLSRWILLDYSILKQPAIGLGAFNYFVLQFTNIGISFVLPIYAQTVLGQNSMIAGLLLLPGSLLGAAVSPIAGRLFDRCGGFVPILIGNLSMTFGCLFFWLFHQQLTPLLIVVFYLFLRFGFNFSFGNTLSSCSLQIRKDKSADLNSMFNMLQQYAGSIGTGIMATFISTSQNSSRNLPEHVLTQLGGGNDFFFLTILGIFGFLSVIHKEHLGRQKKEMIR